MQHFAREVLRPVRVDADGAAHNDTIGLQGARLTAEAATDVFVDYRSLESARVTHIRSTLISSSVQTLREGGFIDRYLACLPKAYHETLLAPQAPSWLPVETAEIHYKSCQSMELSSSDLSALWEKVISNVTSTMLTQFLRTSRSIGGSPWNSLAQSERLYTRLTRGGSLRVSRRGPKEALIESRGSTLYRIPYYASAYTALLRASALLFTKTAYARMLPAPDLDHKVVLAWV